VAVRSAPLLASPLLQPSPSQGGGSLRPAKVSAYESDGRGGGGEVFFDADGDTGRIDFFSMSDRYRFGPFALDAAEHSLSALGKPVTLAGRAFETLLYLVRHPGRLVTREELIGAVWGDTIVEEGNLHWTISVVRRALAQESAETFIETARGLGYRFVAPVEVASSSAPPPPPRTPATQTPATQTPEIQGPEPARSRSLSSSRYWLATGLAALLILAVAWSVAGRRHDRAANGTASLAVVGFRNLTPRGAEGWVGTALTEMLAADLGAGGPFRLVPSDDVAGMRRDLGLQLDGPLGRAELSQIHRHLGSDWVIVGSYLLLPGQDPPLRVDALLRDTATGETRAAVSRRGREEDLFRLSDSLAGDLRRALGETAAGTAGGAAEVRGAMPATPAAQRLYAEGLERLQRMEAQPAAERLEAAVKADPGFPGAWLALARASVLLGSGRRAQEAALQAVELTNGLPERQRLAAEATSLAIAGRRTEAVDRMRRLYELSGRSFEDGLALGDLQIRVGQPREALATFAALRREHPAAADDARLSLLAADAFNWLDDYPSEVASAERAVAASRRQGMVQIEVRALHLLAVARLRAGTAAECGHALEESTLARRKAEASGDSFLLSGVLLDLGTVLADCEKPAAADQVREETLVLFRRIGAFGKTPTLLYNLGDSRLDQGDLLAADQLMHEALETCQAYSFLCRERFLHPLGVNRMHRGELAEARRMIEEGIERNLKLGNRSRVAEARSFLPDLAAWSGDLAQAVVLQRQVLAQRQELRAPRGLVWAHSDLATWLAEAGRGAEALPEARQAVAMAAAQGVTTLSACSRASLAFADLAAGDLAAADRESAQALTLLRPPRYPFCSYIVWRVRAQILLAVGKLDAAGALIDEGLDLARRNGFVTYELVGRLLRAELEQKRGQSAEARRIAEDLAAEARAKGFGLIAQRCAALAGRKAGT
jgi:DNA-binding winged helix-turn-helix (wHTH) protein/tetratricopeptide (TPR) repeat protein